MNSTLWTDEEKLKKELYISVDIETNGPVPGKNAMLSFGAAAVRGEEVVTAFERNLVLPVGTVPDEETMKDFWARFPKAYEATRVNQVSPVLAMTDFCKWAKNIRQEDEIPVFMAYPLTFDWAWMYYYGTNYAYKEWWDTFSFQGLDVKSYAMAAMNSLYTYSAKKYWPKKWSKPKAWKSRTHTHVAIDDAIEQAYQFIEIKKAVESLHGYAEWVKTEQSRPSGSRFADDSKLDESVIVPANTTPAFIDGDKVF